MRRSLWGALLLSACLRPAARPVAPQRSSDTAPAAGTARVWTRSAADYSAWWIGDEGATRRVLLGGRRLESEGGAVRAAAGGFGAPIVAVWSADGRWDFAAVNARWSSPSFLGPLRLVAEVPSGVLGRGNGRVVVIRDGTAEGLGLPAGFVLDAAFGDDLRGLALLEPGRLLHTEDGGQRWSSLALDDAPLEVFAAGGRRWVRGESGCHEVDATGAARASSCDALPLLRPLPPGTSVDALREASSDRDWQPLAFTDASQRRVLVRVREHRDAQHPARGAVYDLDSDDLVAATEGDLPCEPTDIFVADRPYLRCRGEEASAILWSLDADGRWRERLRTWDCERESSCAASADGARVTCTGRCDTGATCAGGTTFCERASEGASRQWTEGSAMRTWSVAGYEGDAPLLVDRREWLAHAELRRGAGGPSPLVASPSAVGLRRDGRDLRLGRDGRIRFGVQGPDGAAHVTLEGAPGGVFRPRPAPPWAALDATRAAFSFCGSDGVAMAIAPDGVPWRSDGVDGPWRPLGPEEIPARSTARQVACSSLGWSPNERDLVVGWGPVAPSRHGAVGIPAPERPRDEPTPWRCTPRGSDRPRSGQPPRMQWVDPASQRDLIQRVGPTVHLWSFARSTPSSPAPRVLRYRAGPPAGGPSSGVPWSMLAADPARATALVWAPDAEGEPPRARLLTLTPGAAPVTSAPLPGWVSASMYGSGRTLVAREGEFIAALSVSAEGYPSAPSRARAAGFLTIAPGAAPMARRVSLDAGLRPPGVFVLDGRAGLWRVRADGSVEGEAPGESTRVLARAVALTACGPSARGAFTLDALAPTPDSTVTSRAEEEYALDGDTLCLRILRSANVIAAPTATGVTGVRDETMTVDCVRPP